MDACIGHNVTMKVTYKSKKHNVVTKVRIGTNSVMMYLLDYFGKYVRILEKTIIKFIIFFDL